MSKKKNRAKQTQQMEIIQFLYTQLTQNDAIQFSSGPHLSILKRKIKLEICS